ncbi:PepSY-associated TM helix domain-containing protein [Promicromonospora iranensis]|uniref:Iron-regulated membrane protein n=1 Tax=Promicromonospora iranensis TaxID=1105144 RepID=A0ABU2CWI5_9MICO|nr:PepSY-associated TM helix domain-containing protein [Promicromonospora iranensis]MDR7385718.1 putative iron-regulated membrane protein [Promicromonospora iranensis]
MTTTVLVAPETERAPRRPGRPVPARPARSGRRQGWFGALLLRLHFYAGLLVGPFILVAAVTGALYALTPALEQVVYRHALHAPATDTQLSLAAQVDIARDHIGDGAATPSAVRPAPEPGDTTRIMFADDRLGASESRAVFVDPGTGEVRGDLTAYGTSGALPLRTWVEQLHGSLHLGDVGRLYSELAASWLGIVALAGLGLWLRRIRTSRARKDLVRPARGRNGYRRLFTWHASVGIWVLLGALFLSVTGITWSQHAGGTVDALRAALDWSTPAVDTHLPDGDAGPAAGGAAGHEGHGGHAGHLSAGAGGATDAALFDAVLATSQAVNVNTGLVEIRPPAEPGTAWVVQEIQRSYPTEVDAVAVDPSSLQVVHRVDFAEFPVAAKLTRWGIDAHMGSLFGLPHQLALFVLAAGIATMVVLGYLMWWKRRPTREPRPLGGTPPRRGALRGAPWWGTGAVLAGAVLVGWWLPLVGWTLAGFVLIDLLVGVAGRRAARAR